MLVASALVGFVRAEAAAQRKVVRPRAGVPGTWRLLGTVSANFRADHDVIVVRGPYDNFFWELCHRLQQIVQRHCWDRTGIESSMRDA